MEPEDIELPTPAMLEAGADALESFFSFPLDDPEKVVLSVFLAMWARVPPGEVQVE